MKQFTLILLVLPLLIFECNLKTRSVQTTENLVQDSLRIDSFRQIKCDSLLNYITETNSGKVNLPDSIPTNLDECIVQLDTCTNDTIKSWIRCVTEIEYVSTLHHGFGMHLRNKWRLWANSDLAKFFNENGIFHPDDMSGIILQCFHEFVNTGKYSMTDKIDYYKEYWNKLKEKEDSLKLINSQKYNETKRFVDSLHQAINYEENFSNIQGLVRDSINFYIEQIRGDTIYLWTSGSSSRLSKKSYLKITKTKRFGKTLFFGYISEDGAIYDMNLKEQRFIRKEGALYYEEQSGGFVKIFTPEMMSNPEKVNEWEPVSDCSFNKSFVKTLWKLEGKKYYYLEMQGKCGSSGLKVRYFIDEDLNVIFDEHIRKKLWKCEKIIDK
jgi:hypothetical protein